MVAELMVAPRLIHDSMVCPHREVPEGTLATTMMVRWIEPDELFARMVNLENEAVQARQRSSSATEVTDTRTLGMPKSSQTTLRNKQHGSEIKAVFEEEL